MNPITKAIWKNNILHYGIVVLVIFIIGFASATTITSNRITNVNGVMIDLSSHISSKTLTNCNQDINTISNAFDTNFNTYVRLSNNGGACTIRIQFDKNYSFESYIIKYVYINETLGEIKLYSPQTASYHTIETINYVDTSPYTDFNHFQDIGYTKCGNDITIATSTPFAGRSVDIYEIKFYGIDEDI